ncbi:MerR family transcriptional regulator [Glaciihabitans sp. dw_435]|uniref:MerR family transcriptional regulator n=1 Tax=Glaciihabitans sp. dw_435 TaxID=2720081 RepID=UPI001BD62A84|nr:MerR family transcriptional regulator [Glaciihabitans sp. dw_435]
MDWAIHDIARLRTLRHYGQIGLLEPSSIGSNGYRRYDERALTRLQRILLLRELGLGLPAIAELLDGQRDDARALLAHLHWLQQEKLRLDRLINSVETTILKMEGGEQLMAEEMFDGFDHTVHRAEVEERWGAEAYARGDSWWRSMTAEERDEWMTRQKQLAADWAAAAASGIPSDGDAAQALAARHFAWLAGIPGTPRSAAGGPTKEYFVGLGEMYATDDRFAANYGGADAARFVRDAMAHYAGLHL